MRPTELNKHPFRAFLLGITHDIGIIILQQQATTQLREVVSAADRDSTQYRSLERNTFGFDHQQLGAGLAEKWKFAPELVICIANHHTPEMVSGTSAHELATIQFIADTIAAQSGVGFCLTARDQAITEEHLLVANLTTGDLAAVKERLPGLVRTASLAA